MSMAGDKFDQEDRDILQADLLYQAREEIKRLQRQVDRLGKDKAKLQSQLLEAAVMAKNVAKGTHDPFTGERAFGSLNEYRQSEKDRY